MRRDLQVVRSILLKIEASDQEHEFQAGTLTIDGVEQSVVAYHVALLIEADLITATDISDLDGEDYSIGRLTWKGHEFVDAARDESRWKKLTRAGMEVVQASGLELIKNGLQAAAAAAAGGIASLVGGAP